MHPFYLAAGQEVFATTGEELVDKVCTIPVRVETDRAVALNLKENSILDIRVG